MSKFKNIAAVCATAILATTLAGCTGDDVFDAIGSQVDPYAQKVGSMNSAGVQPTIQGQEPTQAPAGGAPAGATVTPAQDASAAAPAEPATENPVERKQEEHEYGEAVNIEFDNGTTIFATWTYDSAGEWAAMFGTYNGSIIYAYENTDGSWSFSTVNGQEVIHTDESSTATGEYGPEGLASNWRDSVTGEWY